MAFIQLKVTRKTRKTHKHTPKSKGTIRYTKAPIKARVKKGGVKLASEALVKKGVSNLRNNIHVNRGDTVVVINGSDKGKIGKVLQVFRSAGKIVVEGVNVRKKHNKAQGPGKDGEIVSVECPIFSSKVMIWDATKKKASRVGSKLLKDGKRVRIAKVSGEQID